MICQSCGNQILALAGEACGPVCLVCQHTGRAEWPDVIGSGQAIGSGQSIEHHAKALTIALDAVYEAMAMGEVDYARARLSARIRNSCHNRERPDLEQDAEDDRMQFLEVCQTCFGTGRYLAGRCPDCKGEE